MFETTFHENVAPIIRQLFWMSSPQYRLGYKHLCVAGRAFCYFVLMQLVINGEERTFASATLEALIEELGMKGDRVAVELNREIVPRPAWPSTPLTNGDKLEIVHFVGGG